jgi:glycosyltransferase involved in cell wall biosynthesis
LTRAAALPAGGAETQVLLLARALAARGHEVCLIVFEVHGASIPSRVDDVTVSVRRPYQSHQRLGKLREVASVGQAIASIDSRAVVTRIASPEVGVTGVFAKLLRRTFVYSSSSVSDFVSAQQMQSFTSETAKPEAGRQAGSSAAPSDLDFSRLARQQRDWSLFRLGIRLADEIVVQTHEQVRLCRATFDREPVLIRSIAELAPQRQSEPEAFLWIGRLVDSKRPQEFVELARSLPQACFWMVAVPAGDRSEHASHVSALAATASSTPNLKLLPPRPREDLVDLVNRAVAIVSTSDFEGMPNTFLEGWARGVPALSLAHDPDGVIERHGLGACARGSRQRFVDLAQQLWDGRLAQPNIASRCREYVLHYHSPEVVGGSWADVLGLTDR